ncbi:hypothetical protein KR067_003510, partial [Drosophila pandora]
NQALDLGLTDPEYDELRRSGQPLIKTTQNDNGERVSLTYELSPDGSKISRTRLRELRVPIGSGGYRGSENIQNWEYVSNPPRQAFRPIVEPDFLAMFFDNPFINPLGIGFPQFATLFPDFSPPPGVTPHVTTNTFSDPSGRDYTVTTSHWSTHSGSGQNPFLAPRSFDQLIPGFPNIGSRLYPNNPRLPPAPSYGNSGPANPNVNPAAAGGSSPASFSPSYPTNTEPQGAGNTDGWVPVEQTTSTQRTIVPLPTLPPPKAGENDSDRAIDDFLAKVDLTPTEIEEENGEVVRTIVDKNGRVLSARFVLSTVKGDNEPLKQTKPTK